MKNSLLVPNTTSQCLNQEKCIALKDPISLTLALIQVKTTFIIGLVMLLLSPSKLYSSNYMSLENEV